MIVSKDRRIYIPQVLRPAGAWLLGLILLSGPSVAATVTFADADLEQAVRSAFIALGNPLGPTIDSTDLTGVGFTALQAPNADIDSLSGLEFATDLEELYLRENAISDLTPLASLSALRVLDLGYNQVADLSPLSGLEQLDSLELGFGSPLIDSDEDVDIFGLLGATGANPVSNLAPLAGLNISYLGLAGVDSVTSLSVVNSLPALDTLVAVGTAVSDYTPLQTPDNLRNLILAGTGLDNAGIAVLGTLTLDALAFAYQPAITDLSPLSALNLTVFAAIQLMVPDFGFLATQSNLNELSLISSGIVAIPTLSADALEFVSIGQCPNLTDISGLEGQVSLLELEISASPISDISALESLTGLSILSLDGCQLDDLTPLIANPGLGGSDYLNILNNPLSGPAPSAACDQLPLLLPKFDVLENVVTDAICGEVTTLTIEVVGEGFVLPSGRTLQVPVGTTLPLIAFGMPGSGYAFAGWSGAITSQAGIERILVNETSTVTATFVPNGDHTVQITQSGGGSVIPPPGMHTALDGRTFTVLAAGDGDINYFAGWSGDLSSTLPVFRFPVTTDIAIQANFVNAGHFLTINTVGLGTTTLNPLPGKSEFRIASGNELTFEAFPTAPNWSFSGWEGDIGAADPSNPMLSITMDQEREVTAVFEPDNGDRVLTILSTQSPFPGESGGFTVPPAGAYGYTPGTTATVSATPIAGRIFAGWEGDVPEPNRHDNPLDLVMDQNRVLRANFVPAPDTTLTIQIVGEGTVSVPYGSLIAPNTWGYNDNDTPQVRAVANSAETAFAGWEGDLGDQRPENLYIFPRMDRDRTITAVFVPAEVQLTLTQTGSGSLDPFAPGAYGFLIGQTVNLTATATIDSSFAFQGWEGDQPSTNDYLNFVITEDTAVEAVFVSPGDFTLTMNPPANPFWGNTFPNPGTYAFLSGRTTRANANANTGYFFDGWTGTIVSDDFGVDILMDTNHTLTPHFSTDGFQLQIDVEGNGFVNPGIGQFGIAAGRAPTLIASAGFGYRFETWEGDLPQGADPLDPNLPVLMDQDRHLTAVFVQDGYFLNLQVQGEGSTNPPAGSNFFSEGTEIFLTATPIEGGAFLEWQGDIGDQDPNSAAITLTMTQNRNVTAVFAAYDFTLTVAVSGTGSATPLGTSQHFAGQSVPLSATLIADSGFAFSQWSGDIASTDLNTTVVMDADKFVTAAFVEGDVELTLSSDGTGDGDLSLPAGVYAFLQGQTIDLAATPDDASEFTGWAGDIGDADPFSPFLTLTMNQNRAVAATFTLLATVNLKINVVGPGTTNPAAGTTEYVKDRVAFVTATPGSGARFKEWTGDIGDVEPDRQSVILIMDRDREITANFGLTDHTLTLTQRGQGLVVPDPGVYELFDGETFLLEAITIEGTGQVFSRWEGDIGDNDPTDPVITLTVTQDSEVEAVFEPGDALFCQGYLPSATPYVSDTTAGFRIFDSFSGVTGPVAGLTWWGVNAFRATNQFAPCSRDPQDFEVVLFEDDGGQPGTEVYAETFTVNAIDTGDNFFDYDIFAYAVTFTTPVQIESGWLSVRGTNDVDCWLLWMGSDQGDGVTLQYTESTGIYAERGPDSAFCLAGLPPPVNHAADQNGDGKISLSELLRVIQFYNLTGYGCQSDTEDGYAPDDPDQDCTPHSSDYNPQDWDIALTELLRLIQFYNLGGIVACPADPLSEDGFCLP